MLASKTLRYGRLHLAGGPRQQARDSSNKMTHKVTRCHHLGLLHLHDSLESDVPSCSRRRRPRQPLSRAEAALCPGSPACAPSIGRGGGGFGCAIHGRARFVNIPVRPARWQPSVNCQDDACAGAPDVADASPGWAIGRCDDDGSSATRSPARIRGRGKNGGGPRAVKPFADRKLQDIVASGTT